MDSEWRGRRVLVTGATGLVGSWLTKALLRSGAEVAALIRDWDPHSELIRSGDVNRVWVFSGSLEDWPTVRRAVEEHQADTVLHLGAQTIVGTALKNPLATFEANIRGTYHVLEACRLQGQAVKAIVIASSDKAYGESDVLPYVETMPVNGRHPYDVSKSCVDLLSVTYAETYGLPVSVARCGNIYGGGDLNWSRIVPGTIRSVLAGQRPILRSDGLSIRDYIFVQDIVRAYLVLAARTPEDGIRGEAFNFSPQAQIDVLGITRTIQRLLNRTDLEPIILNEARAEIRHQYLDSAKATRLLGWTPVYDLDRGLTETIDWYRDFLANERLVAHAM